MKLAERKTRPRAGAYTLIEIMMVVAIIGIIMAIGIPSMLRMMKKQGMRKALSEVREVCDTARARAIMSGTTTMLVFHPLERTASVSGGGSGPGGPPPSALSSARIPDDVSIEMLDINLLEYNESDEARVRFFPNGTSDEMTLILRSDDNEWNAITLEITTGLAHVESDMRKLGR